MSHDALNSDFTDKFFTFHFIYLFYFVEKQYDICGVVLPYRGAATRFCIKNFILFHLWRTIFHCNNDYSTIGKIGIVLAKILSSAQPLRAQHSAVSYARVSLEQS